MKRLPLRLCDRAWLALGAAICAYEIACPPGELLSEGVDHYLQRRPWTTRAVVLGLALHLLNIIPQRVDPLHQFAILVKEKRHEQHMDSSVLERCGRAGD